jgi:hypothetical protein
MRMQHVADKLANPAKADDDRIGRRTVHARLQEGGGLRCGGPSCQALGERAKEWHGEHRKSHRDHRLRAGVGGHGLGGDGRGDDDESKFPAGC